MATGRVWAGFFHTRIQPTTLDPQPGPIIKWIYFQNPDPPHWAHLAQPDLGPSGIPNCGPTKKKKKRIELNGVHIQNMVLFVFM